MTADRASRPPLPDPDELISRARVVRLPMTVRFRGVTEREVMLIHGNARWTEWSPFLEYADEEAATWLRGALEYGFSEAFHPLDASVPVNATVPAVSPERVACVLERYGSCRAVKVKVAERGQSLADDIARVAEVRRCVGPDARIRVDANAGWSLDEAAAALPPLAEAADGLDYAEQPVAAVEDLARLRERLRGEVAIAADESIRKASDPLRVAKLGAADRIIVKAQPLGGISRAAAIVRECGLPATVSSALDSSVGLAMGAQLAARVAADSGEPAAPAGLGTGALFERDVTEHPRVPERGVISAAPVEVDADALNRLKAPPERVAWWQERLRRCLDLIRD